MQRHAHQQAPLVGELRTGRIGEAGTTFEELRETLTAWVGQVAPEQEGIVAEALRRAAFEQGQFRGQSAQASPAPSGAAASAPAVLSSASDAEPIVVEERGDDIGLANSDGEPETHHPFTTEGIPLPEPDGLIRGANRVQPRSSSVPAVPQKAPPTVTGAPLLRQAQRSPTRSRLLFHRGQTGPRQRLL